MVYKLKTWRLPQGSRTSKGKAIVNILPIPTGVSVAAILPIDRDEKEWSELQIMFATSAGDVRQNRLSDFTNVMRNGKIVQQGAPYNVYTRPIDRASVAFFSDANVLRASVSGALAQTPFGRFLAPGVPDGTAVDIVFRPQHVRIDFDRGGKGPAPTATDGAAARAVVERARFMGNESLVEFRMDHDGSKRRVTVPNVFLPSVGKALWLTIRRDRCFVFPKSA